MRKYNVNSISKLVGKGFIHCDSPEMLYKIKELEGDKVTVSWDRYSSLSYPGSTGYFVEDVVKYLNEGTWILK